jgi:hypothetical protein
MKSLKRTRIPSCSVMILFAAFFISSQSVSHADLKPMKPSNQMQIQKKETLSLKPVLKLCPDLKVSLNVFKGSSGLVTLRGTVSNVGGGDYNILSEAQVFMNLSYPPKSYNQVGVSEQVCTKIFSKVAKGASFPVNCSFQIPNFDGWGTAIKPGNAKRLFTLRVVKKNMSPFKTGEECNPNNNSKGVEVKYQEKQQ